MTSFARELLQHFPRARSVFAYGSAAFRQPGLYDAPTQHAPMLDIIFAADNPAAWHHEMCALCESIGRGVHFNPYASLGRQNIKYGVMRTSVLLHDLWTWDDFFMAGRLHKPVLHLVRDHLVDKAVRANLDSALAAALLCLPANFTCQALMETICGLSYTGDIRMRWGEDSQKVQRIVQGSWSSLKHIFLPQLQGFVGRAAKLRPLNGKYTLQRLELNSELAQNVGIAQTRLLLSTLPQACVKTKHKATMAGAEWCREEIAALLSAELCSVISRSSTRQAIWGLASAGPYKALHYTLAKVRHRHKF